MINLYNAVILLTEMTLALTAVDLIKNKLISRETKVRGVVTSIIIGIAALAECVAESLSDNTELIGLHAGIELVEICLLPVTGVAIALSYGTAIRPKLAAALCCVHAVVQIVALPSGAIFTIGTSGVFRMGRFFELYILVLVATIIYAAVCIAIFDRKYQKKIDLLLFFSLIILAEGIGKLFAEPAIWVLYMCIAATNVICYMNYYKTMLRIDAVTQLLNRRNYDGSIGNVSAGAAIIMLDIDKFKIVNDTYGHKFGDCCLQEIGGCILRTYRSVGQCFRIGGDEFCVIIENIECSIESLNEQFAKEIEELRNRDSRMPDISLGYGYYDYGMSDISEALKAADDMLYKNKKEKL